MKRGELFVDRGGHTEVKLKPKFARPLCILDKFKK